MRPEHCAYRLEDSLGKSPSELTEEDFGQETTFCTGGRSLEKKMQTSLVTMTNNERFDSKLDEPFVKEAKFDFTPTNYKQLGISHQIKHTIVDSDNNRYLSLPGVTDTSRELMEVAPSGDFALVMDYFTRVTLEFELDLNARVVEHSTEKL